MAAFAVGLLHEAGIPKDAVQLVPGLGETVGAALVTDERVDGVVFTGGFPTAKAIQRALAAKDGPIVPFIAETGGQNAMIVDSSALPEQVVDDVLNSAFGSAGQRCSSLRVVFLQRDIAETIITLLQGAMQELKIGDPHDIATDIGPLIDTGAADGIRQHLAYLATIGTKLGVVPLPDTCKTEPRFVAPEMWEIPSLSVLKQEVFGPVLHVVRYDAAALDTVIDQIHATGYGLTFGMHSRILDVYEGVGARMKVGQHLSQPRHDRCGGRHPALRRRRPLRNRPQSRRAAVPDAVCDRADGKRQHRGDWREC